MRDVRRHGVRGLIAAALLAPATASALPWNVDMVDSAIVKGFEKPMAGLPAGVMSQPHLLTPVAYRRNYSVLSEARTALANPLDAADPQVQALGARMWDVYCWPCHGSTEAPGPVAERWALVPRLLPPSDGAQPWDDRLTRLPDGHVYLTIRNGSPSGLMRPYGYAMNDAEMWAIVAWLRTNPTLAIPGAAAPAGDQPAPEGAPVDGAVPAPEDL